MSKKKEHRFWVYSDGAYVRLKMKEGDSFERLSGGPHEEGYCWVAEQWDHNGDHIAFTSASDSRDCDGRLYQVTELACSVDKLSAVPTEADHYTCKCKGFDRHEYLDEVSFVHRAECFRPARPDWEEEKSFQRDEYAEAMGY